MAYELLAQWGHDGFFAHIKQVASFYEAKAKMFLECLDEHMTGYGEWTACDGGMFVWLKMLGGIKDSRKVILEKATAKNVLAVPGAVSFFF
jgi:kynurenine/2-aminoadipate aminotransferase